MNFQQRQRAISALSDARLNRDYSSKILQAISLAPDATPLILKYVRTVKPPLTQPDDLGIYMIALAETNIFEAWQFQRTFNELDETRSRLFKKLIEWMVTRTLDFLSPLPVIGTQLSRML